MRSKQEIVDFLIQNKDPLDKDRHKEIDSILEDLHENESIEYVFGTTRIFDEHGEIVAQGSNIFALTQDRLIYSGFNRKVLMTESIPLENIVSVKAGKQGFIDTDIVFSTSGSKIITNVYKKCAPETLKQINRIIETAKKKPVSSTNSAADEIKKYMELLYVGAITQEEFDAKKKQLLGL